MPRLWKGGGDFVAPGETSGRVFAIGPDGSVVTLVVSGLPHAGDIGVQSAGFVPPGFSADDAAHLSCAARYIAAGLGQRGRRSLDAVACAGSRRPVMRHPQPRHASAVPASAMAGVLFLGGALGRFVSGTGVSWCRQVAG